MEKKIWIESHLLQKSSWLKKITHYGARFAIITDRHLTHLLGIPLQKMFEKEGVSSHLISIPAGESHKTRATKELIEDAMLKEGLGSDSALIALGGGVVTDLGGFVAATYCRGIPFISIPTTLLGQVDAGIGGKVGVNTPFGKNLIGTFYLPKCVLIDPNLLASLPKGEWLNGMAEVIKYALIASSDLFEVLEPTVSPEDPVLETLIQSSCTIKQRVVEKDPFDKGERRILNFGHTVGHGIEMASLYTITHGEAIAIGQIVEARLSCQLGFLSEKEYQRIEALFHSYGFSLSLPKIVEKEGVWRAMQQDKKAKNNAPRFVFLNGIGSCEPFEGAFCQHVAENDVAELLKWMFQKFMRPSHYHTAR